MGAFDTQLPEPEELQRILEDLFLEEGLTFSPPDVRELVVSSLVQRTLAHLVGLDGRQARMVRVTAAGHVITAPTTTAIDTNDTKTGTSTDAGVNETFDAQAARVDVWIDTNNVQVARSIAAPPAFQDNILVRAGDFYSFDALTTVLRFTSATPGSHGGYVAVGWF